MVAQVLPTALRAPVVPRERAILVLGAITLSATVGALYMALVASPPEQFEGDRFRIFYFHVPLGILTYVAFFVTFLASLVYLWKPLGFWDRLARCSAEIGLLFCTLVLATGSIWGRSVWGVWWTWDARLTSTLVLWFIYLAYLMVRSYVDDRGRAARYAAVLGVLGFLDVPVVQFSVNWWRTLHPQSTILASGGSSLAPSMLLALLWGMVAVSLLYALLLVLRLRTEALVEAAMELRLRLNEIEDGERP